MLELLLVNSLQLLVELLDSAGLSQLIRIGNLADGRPEVVYEDYVRLECLGEPLRYVVLVCQNLHWLFKLVLDVPDGIEKVTVAREQGETPYRRNLGKLHQFDSNRHVDLSLHFLFALVFAVGAHKIFKLIVSYIEGGTLGLK